MNQVYEPYWKLSYLFLGSETDTVIAFIYTTQKVRAGFPKAWQSTYHKTSSIHLSKGLLFLGTSNYEHLYRQKVNANK